MTQIDPGQVRTVKRIDGEGWGGHIQAVSDDFRDAMENVERRKSFEEVGLISAF